MLRGALLCLLLASAVGCEVEPGSRRTPPEPSAASGSAAAPDTAAPSGSAAPTPAAPTPAQPASAAASKESCTRAAARLFDLQNAAVPDPAQRAANDQQRQEIVNRTTDACTGAGWSEAAVDCIVKAADMNALQPCAQIIQNDQIARRAAPGNEQPTSPTAPTPAAPTPAAPTPAPSAPPAPAPTAPPAH